jgi:hypothetical protein
MPHDVADDAAIGVKHLVAVPGGRFRKFRGNMEDDNELDHRSFQSAGNK